MFGSNSPYTRQPELATIGAVTLADLNAWHDRTIGGKLICLLILVPTALMEGVYVGLKHAAAVLEKGM